MKCRLLLLAVAFQLTIVAQAQPRFDTLATRPIGPGLTHTHIVDPHTPWNINVIEVDLTDPYVKMQSMKGQNRIGGRETVGSMASRHDRDGHRVVAAINGDFYTTSWPVAMQVVDGEMVLGPVPNRPGVSFSSTNQAMLEVPVFDGVLTLPDTALTIDGVNRARLDGDLILYNRFQGSVTGTTSEGSEVVVRVVDDWAVNETFRVVVDEVRSNTGNTAIEPETAVFSGHGDIGAALVGNVEIDDTLSIRLEGRPATDDIRQMISGGPFIIKDGQVDVGARGDGVDRHPRTAVGLSADSTRFYMVTVDGRQSASAGMTLHELAEFMVSIGVDRAMNLDGGGSTTLIVYGEPENSLLGAQRAVANGLAVVSLAPFGDLTTLRLRQQTLRIFRGNSFRFDVEGYDDYNHPVEIDSVRLEFSADSQIGTISDAGVLTAATTPDSGYVYAHYGELVDSALVVLKDIESISVSPTDLVTDTTRTVTFRVTGRDSDGITQEVMPTEFEWTVLDETVGEITEEGTFKGLQSGTTGVVVSYGEAADTATVTIQIGVGRESLNTFESLEGWTVETRNVIEEGTGVEVVEDEEESMLRVDYRFDNSVGFGTARELLLHSDMELFGVPDSIFLDVLSDGLRHRVYFLFEDREGTEFTAYVPKFITESEDFDRLGARIDRSGMVHPITLKSIGFMFGTANVAGELDEGSLYVDNLSISYSAGSSVSAEPIGELPHEIILEQNYPNPFNPSTTISYRLGSATDVQLRIYDVLGRLVETIVDGPQPAGSHSVVWDAGKSDAGSLASGTYFYVLEVDGRRVTRSMVLLK